MYLQDKKQGYGVYEWHDGRKYAGYWVNGKQQGIGKYYTNETDFKVGLWEDGKRISWVEQDC